MAKQLELDNTIKLVDEILADYEQGANTVLEPLASKRPGVTGLAIAMLLAAEPSESTTDAWKSKDVEKSS